MVATQVHLFNMNCINPSSKPQLTTSTDLITHLFTVTVQMHFSFLAMTVQIHPISPAQLFDELKPTDLCGSRRDE